MEKITWNDTSPDQSNTVWASGRERGGLDAARGLIIGLAISQVFWLVLAFCLAPFWMHSL